MPRVTLSDIARIAGVHPSTVSRALDPEKSTLVQEDTRERVLAAAEQLGFRPDAVASGLRRGRTNTIGVIVADLGNPFIAPVLRGIENNLEGRDILAFISETQDKHGRLNRVIDAMLRRRVDAIITTAARAGDEHTLRKVMEVAPTVLAVRSLPSTGLPSVTHDDERGGQLAAAHLLDLGHTRLAQLRGPGDISSFVDRARGFSAEVLRRGASEIVLDEIGEHPIVPEGRRLMRRLLARVGPHPTAVFAHNDLMALGALEEMQRFGLECPDDIAIMGYNDSPQTAYLRPSLSTIRLTGYHLGRLAADMAVMLIEGTSGATTALSLPPSVVARASTRAPRTAA
jgi:LacI family transcriptional regulator